MRGATRPPLRARRGRGAAARPAGPAAYAVCRAGRGPGRRRLGGRAGAASPSKEDAALETLDRLRSGGAGPGPSTLAGGSTEVWGTGEHLGMEVEWRMSFAPDGAFKEEVTSPYYSLSWGYDGKAAVW